MNPATGLAPLRAGVEHFLPLLVFFFIWVVSSRRARKNRMTGDQRGRARRSSQLSGEGSGDEVDPLEVLRQMFMGGMEIPSRSEPSPPPDAPFVPVHKEYNQGVAEWTVEQPLPPAPAKKVVSLAPLLNEVKAAHGRKFTQPEEVSLKSKKLTLILAQTSRQELQRAIAWSEVLAPPVGLRDTSR